MSIARIENLAVYAILRIDTNLKPLQLLYYLQEIETTQGRRRTNNKNGPTIIDIDILLFKGQNIHEENLIVPHPRMFERKFVLLPLAELLSASSRCSSK